MLFKSRSIGIPGCILLLFLIIILLPLIVVLWIIGLVYQLISGRRLFSRNAFYSQMAGAQFKRNRHAKGFEEEYSETTYRNYSADENGDTIDVEAHEVKKESKYLD